MPDQRGFCCNQQETSVTFCLRETDSLDQVSGDSPKMWTSQRPNKKLQTVFCSVPLGEVLLTLILTQWSKVLEFHADLNGCYFRLKSFSVAAGPWWGWSEEGWGGRGSLDLTQQFNAELQFETKSLRCFRDCSSGEWDFLVYVHSMRARCGRCNCSQFKCIHLCVAMCLRTRTCQQVIYSSPTLRQTLLCACRADQRLDYLSQSRYHLFC